MSYRLNWEKSSRFVLFSIGITVRVACVAYWRFSSICSVIHFGHTELTFAEMEAVQRNFRSLTFGHLCDPIQYWVMLSWCRVHIHKIDGDVAVEQDVPCEISWEERLWIWILCCEWIFWKEIGRLKTEWDIYLFNPTGIRDLFYGISYELKGIVKSLVKIDHNDFAKTYRLMNEF